MSKVWKVWNTDANETTYEVVLANSMDEALEKGKKKNPNINTAQVINTDPCSTCDDRATCTRAGGNNGEER